MQKPGMKLLILCLFALLWSGCGPQTAAGEVERSAPVAGGGATVTVAPPPLPTATSTALASPLVVETTMAPTMPTWSTYKVGNKLTIEYPSGWETRSLELAPANTDYYFSPPGFHPPETMSDEQLTLGVYHRPLADRAIANPMTWMPNEGGYEAHWLTPIQVVGAEGWLFVWGASAAGRSDVKSGLWAYGPELMAVYYSERYELDVRMMGGFDDESTLLAQEIGLVATVAQRYPVFEHMMKSIRFVEPVK